MGPQISVCVHIAFTLPATRALQDAGCMLSLYISMAQLPLMTAFLELAQEPHDKDPFQWLIQSSHLAQPSRAAAPEIISVSSVVMAA